MADSVRPNAIAGPSGLRSIPEGTLRVGPIQGVPEVLHDLGVDPAEVLASAGVDPSLFEDSENLIGFATMGRLFRLCVARTGCQHFGLLLTREAALSSLGLVGFLAQHAPTVGAALRDLVEHLRLHDRGAVPILSVQGDVASLAYVIYQPGVEAAEQICDGAMAVGFNIMRGLRGPGWRPSEVHLSHRRPSDPGPFLRFFQAPVRFDADQSALVFPASDLERPRPAADPALYRLLQQQVELIERQSRDEFVSHVRELLQARLADGKDSLQGVAALLSMHRRTLNRRLEACGTSFRILRQQARFDRAQWLLENTDLPLSQVAAILGYSDVSAFTRAFRRWSGTTPGQWRRKREGRARVRSHIPTPDVGM